MATNSPSTNSHPAKAPAPVVIRYQPVLTQDRPSLSRLLPAGVISAVVHVVLLGLFLTVTVSGSAAPVTAETSVIETKVEDNPQEKNLENEDIGGDDPELPTNYNLNRIEDVSVPGPVDPTAPVGITNAPDGPPMTVPPPPGFGGGQGGGVDSPTLGKGSLFGTPGGMGGPQLIAGGFGGRSGATREQMVREGGGNTRSEAAVASGLKWLIAHQAPDGHWSLQGFPQYGKCNCTGFGQSNDIAGTAFGLLPLLAAGETHKSTGKNSLYAKHVERGLKYLIIKQGKDGNFGGGLYAHGLASIAMCEAFGLITDPALKGPAQRALDFIAYAQRDGGGWDYGPRGPGFDTSVSGWQLMALKSGQMSGLSVTKETLRKAQTWLDAAASPDGASYGYRSAAGVGAGGAMTAAGLLCRQYLGWGPRNPGLVKGVELLKKSPPTPAPGLGMYHYYYATQVMHHMGGESWEFWNPKMRDALIERQDKGTDAKRPHQKGSWDTKGDGICGHGGRMMSTSLSLLTLEVYYRHLPLYRRDMGGMKDKD